MHVPKRVSEIASSETLRLPTYTNMLTNLSLRGIKSKVCFINYYQSSNSPSMTNNAVRFPVTTKHWYNTLMRLKQSRGNW